MLTSRLMGLPHVFSMRVESLRDAYTNRATRFLHGYFTRRASGLHLEIRLEVSNRIRDTAGFDGDWFHIADQLAKRLDPQARAFPSADRGAIEAWARGQYERAVERDADFGPAYLAWAQSAPDRERALVIVERALSRPDLRAPIEKAQLALVDATLRDDLDGRRTALQALARLVPSDYTALQQLAELELLARRFQAAVEAFRSALRLERAPGLLNEIGYALALAGDLDGARASLEEYRRAPGEEANALDSLGEIHFYHGRFAESERYFLQAHEINAALLQGRDLEKAAHARWLAGDLKSADALFQRYLEFRRNLGDPLLEWRQAEWEYATGRRQQAIARLQAFPHEIAKAQLAIWREKPLAQPLAQLKEVYERTSPNLDGQVRTFYAWALAETGHVEEAKPLLRLYPLPQEVPDRLYRSLVYPKFLELRQRLYPR